MFSLKEGVSMSVDSQVFFFLFFFPYKKKKIPISYLYFLYFQN